MKFVAICVLLFLLLGVILIPCLGIQNDEALGANALYPPFQFAWALETPLGTVPIMIASYAGCLKMWLFAVVFSLWTPSVWSLRLPGLGAGMASIGCFYLWVRDAHGLRAARYACLLLSFDFSFLATHTFDWGPVALQHLLLTFGLMASYRYHQTQRVAWLAAGSFAFGLGVWDKALFGALLFGVGAATITFYRRELLDFASRRRLLAVAALSFVAGSSPLIFYNLGNQGETIAANAEFDVSPSMLIYKLDVLSETLDGSALFDYMLRTEAGDSVNVYRHDFTPSTPMPVLFVCSILLAFAWPRSSKFLKWSVSAAMLAYLPFLVGDGFGGGAHHVVLLWPLPQLAVALALADAGIWGGRFRRAPEYAVPTLLIAATLISNGVIYARFVDRCRRNGPTVIWTDAIIGLNGALSGLDARNVVLLDWGMHDPLRLLSRGELPLTMGVDPFQSGSPSPDVAEPAARMVNQQRAYFVDHTNGNRIFPDVRENFDRYIEDQDLRAVTIAVVPDRLGRAVFEVFCLQPIDAATACLSQSANQRLHRSP